MTNHFKTWFLNFVLLVGITILVIFLYNQFAPFYGINPRTIADKLYYPAQSLSIFLAITALLIFGVTNQKYQSVLLKVSLFPLIYGLFAFLFKGSIQDFAWFLSLAVTLQALNLFIIFSHHRPIGKTLLVSLIFLVCGLFVTDDLGGQAIQKTPPTTKNINTPTPQPTYIPHRSDLNINVVSPKTGYNANISSKESTQVSLRFFDWQNHTPLGNKLEFELPIDEQLAYAWNPTGTVFAIAKDHNIDLIDLVANNQTTIKINYPTKNLTFSGDNKLLYYTVAITDTTNQVMAYNLSTKTQQEITTIPDSNYNATLVPLPNKPGFAYVKLVNNTYRIFVVTPNSTKQLKIEINEDSVGDLVFSPNLNHICLGGYSSGAGRYYLIKNNQIIKMGPDGSYCKAWINSDTIMLHEGNSFQSVYNFSTRSYLYHSRSR